VVEVVIEGVRAELLGNVELAMESMGVGEQASEATADEVLAEEDDGGEVPWPGFASRRCRQALGVGGA
jgi:hypothetical protein